METLPGGLAQREGFLEEGAGGNTAVWGGGTGKPANLKGSQE